MYNNTALRSSIAGSAWVCLRAVAPFCTFSYPDFSPAKNERSRVSPVLLCREASVLYGHSIRVL